MPICSSSGAGRRTRLQYPLFTTVKRPAVSIWAMPTTDWLNMARRMCSCWRNLVSMRFRTATCALRARLTTEMLSMNAISGRNASSRVAPANGPPAANVPQAAKHERMSTRGAPRAPPSAPQRGPQQRHGCQDPQRASVHALLDEGTEGDKAHGSRRDNGGAGGQDLV